MSLPVEICCWQHLDKNGVVLPWYTKPFLDVLQTWPIKKWRVFEFGGGYSTIWYSRNARDVVSIDQDAAWVATVQPELGSNASITCCPAEQQYLSFIDTQGQFDLIIIDGSFREKCAPKAMEHIKDGGIVVLDNSESYGSSVGRVFLYNEHHSFPQPRHPDWRTDYWVINERERWDSVSYEEAGHREAGREPVPAPVVGAAFSLNV